MKIFALAVIVIAHVFADRAVIAQPVGLNVEDRVRATVLISTVKIRYTGAVQPSRSDRLTIVTDGGPLSFALSDVHRIEASRGMRKNEGRGALIGAAACGVVLGSIAAASELSCGGTYNICFGVPMAFAMGGGLGLLVGAVAGAVAGQFVLTERWVNLAVEGRPQAGSSIGLGPTGLTLTFTLEGHRR